MEQVTKHILPSNEEKDGCTRMSHDPPHEHNGSLKEKITSEHISKLIDRIFQLTFLILLYSVFVFATDKYLEKSPDLLGKVLLGLFATVLIVFGLGGIVERYLKK